MKRQDALPIVGLIALAVAGGAMLWVMGPPPEDPRPAPVAAAKGPPRTTDKPSALEFKRDIGDRVAAPEGAPSFVVVAGCAIRRDTIGPYGGPPGLTPNIDALARAGAVFDDAIATAPSTRPSLAAMFTGRFALDLGLESADATGGTRPMRQTAHTVAEVLAERGWWTVAVNASPSATRAASGLWQGFDHVRDADPQGWKPERRLDAADATAALGEMLADRPKDRPFFAVVFLTDAHKPLKVAPDESRPWGDLPNPAYMAAVRRMDDSVGQVSGWLAAQGLADTTYVVALTDHGEGLGRPAHHGPAHGRYLYPTAMAIPWIVRGPGIPADRHVAGLASGVDVGPTLLGLAGLGSALKDVDGRDWSERLRGGAASTDRDIAFSDTWYQGANRAAVWTATHQCQKDFGSSDLEGDWVDGCFDRADPAFAATIDDPTLMDRLARWRADKEAAAATEPPPPRPAAKGKALPAKARSPSPR